MKKATTHKNLMFLLLCLFGSFQISWAASTADKPEMRLDSIIQYNNNIGTNVKYLKTEYARDLQQNVTLKMVYSWKTASDGITTFWMYSQKEDMTYDDRNRLETRQNYSWNSNSGTWDSSTRKNEHFFYNKDNGRIDSVFYYRWDGYEWLDNYEKEVYSYSDDGLKSTAIWYKDLGYNNPNWPTAWDPVEKREFVYDENHHLLSLTFFYWGGYYPDGDWAPSDRDEYTYNEHGDVLTYSKYMPTSDGGWIESSGYKLKHEYIYDDKGNIISDMTYRMESDKWNLDTHYTYEYYYSEIPVNVKDVPYSESFDTDAAIKNDYTVWKANTTKVVTWQWESASQDVKCTQTEANDYLFTPALYLPTTHRYLLTFKARCEKADALGKLKVVACNALKPNMSISTLVNTNITNTENQTYTAKLVVPLQTTYYIGFCAYTSDGSAIYLDDVKMEPEKLIDVPVAIDYLTGSPAAGGVNQVTLQFYIPNSNLSGLRINGVDGYVIMRDDMAEPIYKVDKFQTRDEMITWVDNNAKEGENTYSIYTYNEYGNSDEATITVVTGTDYPGRINNLRAEEPELGVCRLTWEAPTGGAAGGSFTQEGLTYNVYRYEGVQDELIATGITELTYTDYGMEVADRQVPVQYAVSAVNEAGEGLLASTDVILLGNPYPMPFNESFTDCAFENYLWTTIGIKGASSWAFASTGINPDVNPQDNDGGMMVFTSVQFLPGNMSRLTSPKIDISKGEKPVLSFWMAHSTNTNITTIGDDALVVKVSANNGVYERLDSILVKSDKDGWIEHTLSLDAYKGCENIRLGFVGVAGRTNNIYIDNVSVTDKAESSISATDGGQIRIYSDNGFVIVEGANDEAVTICTVDGKTVYSSKQLNGNRIPLQKGFYLVSVGSRKAAKVTVK